MKGLIQDKAAVSKAVQSASTIEAYTIEGRSYNLFRGQQVNYDTLAGAFTAAGIITAAYGKITPAGRIEPIAGAKPQIHLLQKILSDTAFSKWTGKLKAAKHGTLLDENGFTPEGINFINARLSSSGPAYNTTKEMVDAFLVSMGTGKALKIKGVKGIKFVKTPPAKRV